MDTNYKILVVDDEINILKAMERTLRRTGFEIITAHGGEAALNRLKDDNDIAVVLSDLRMPEVNGVSVLSYASEICPDATRIAITGQADMDMIMGAVNSGKVARFIMKPWDDKNLRKDLTEAVNAYQILYKHRQLEQMNFHHIEVLKEFKTNLEKEVKDRTGQLEITKLKIEKTLHDVVKAFSHIMEIQSPGLRGHVTRVGDMSRALAVQYGFDMLEINQIETAARLHDIGYMSLERFILNKPHEKYSEKEYERYQRHTLVGFELLKNISGFEEVARIVLHHHECFNGEGFPDQLRADKIPIGARIIAIANLYDRTLYPRGKALIGRRSEAEYALREAAGDQLDKELVKLFLDKNIPEVVAARWPEVEVSMADLKDGMVLTRDVCNVAGIPLLKKGTRLTEHLINKLRINEEMDVMISRIYIARKTLEEELKNPPIEKQNFSPYLKTQRKSENLDPIMVLKNAGGKQKIQNQPEKETAPAREADSTEQKEQHLMKPIVVIVDDDPQIVNALKRELRSGGYRPVGFNEVIPTFNYLRQNLDVLALIADFNMPVMRGDTFLTLVHEEFPELPYIVITGEATRENVILLGKAAKPLRILPKPWKKTELLETIDKIKKEKEMH